MITEFLVQTARVQVSPDSSAQGKFKTAEQTDSYQHVR